jgi:hypothetical protein
LFFTVGVTVKASEFRLAPEIFKVYNKENQNKGTEDTHVPRRPNRRLASGFCVTLWSASAAVVNGQDQRNNDVKENEGKVALGNQLDQGIVAHELSIPVKRFTLICFEQLKVAYQVYDKE